MRRMGKYRGGMMNLKKNKEKTLQKMLRTQQRRMNEIQRKIERIKKHEEGER